MWKFWSYTVEPQQTYCMKIPLVYAKLSHNGSFFWLPKYLQKIISKIEKKS